MANRDPLSIEGLVARAHKDVGEALKVQLPLSPELAIAARRSPAAIAAIVRNFCTPAQRREALAALLSDRPRSYAEDIIGVPRWVSDLPMHALDGDYADLPSGPDFDGAITAVLPANESKLPAFLAAMRAINRHAGAEAALWLAREMARNRIVEVSSEHAEHLGFFIAASVEGGPLAGFIEKPWSVQMSLPAAARQALYFPHWLALGASVGGRGIVDSWRIGDEFRGYRFDALVTPQQYIAVARKLNNCLYSYVGRLLANRSRIFSISRDGEVVAAMELVRNEHGELAMGPVLGPDNKRVPPDLARAAHAFMADSEPVIRGAESPSESFRKLPQRRISENWRDLVGDYVRTRPHIRYPAVSGTEASLTIMLRAVGTLNRIAERR